MGLITKGMGAILKGAKKGSKKVVKRVKEDAPFIGAVAGVEGAKHVYNQLIKKDLKGKPHSTQRDPHHGTLTGTALLIKEALKQRKKNKKNKKDKE